MSVHVTITLGTRARCLITLSQYLVYLLFQFHSQNQLHDVKKQISRVHRNNVIEEQNTVSTTRLVDTSYLGISPCSIPSQYSTGNLNTHRSGYGEADIRSVELHCRWIAFSENMAALICDIEISLRKDMVHISKGHFKYVSGRITIDPARVALSVYRRTRCSFLASETDQLICTEPFEAPPSWADTVLREPQ